MSLNNTLKLLSTTRSLGAIAFLGLALNLGGVNPSLKQIGFSLALVSGGAAAATRRQKEERLADVAHFKAGHERREAALTTSLDIAMGEAETLAAQLTQMNAVLAEWQREKVLITGQLETLKKEQRQLLCDLYETTVAETRLAEKETQSRTTFHRETNRLQAEAAARISDLETALAAKTDLATQMLTELEAEATGTFNHFNAKVTSQGQLIDSLRQQIATLKQAALRQRQTALIDRPLAKQASQRMPGKANNFAQHPLVNNSLASH
ncbi:MAG: hypothetical protein AAF050_20365 [Cyanobacteria bacterium J06649_5]